MLAYLFYRAFGVCWVCFLSPTMEVWVQIGWLGSWLHSFHPGLLSVAFEVGIGEPRRAIIFDSFVSRPSEARLSWYSRMSRNSSVNFVEQLFQVKNRIHLLHSFLEKRELPEALFDVLDLCSLRAFVAISYASPTSIRRSRRLEGQPK